MIYDTISFPYDEFGKLKLQKRGRGNQRSRRTKFRFLDVISAFDIETTNDFESNQAFMYIWQMQIGEWTVIGRTWFDWIDFLSKLAERMPAESKMLIFVHNLSFEFQFLKGIYPFQPEEVFAIESRKVLKCEMFDVFEFRCSYLQTNMSLAEFTHKMGVDAAKLSGEDFDYSKQRYPWTELTDQELEYCVNDVKGLVQAMRVQMDLEHDNFYTLPLTSTGYVRRDVKAAMRHYNRSALSSQLPDYEVFKILREAFRGGNTHANRYFTDQIIDNVKSFDRVSSYPDVQLNRKFPMSAWIREDPEALTLDRVVRKIEKHGRACLMRCAFHNIQLQDLITGCPYIPLAKCRYPMDYENDNGRIISAAYLEISLTDIDLKIILDQYQFDTVTFLDFYHCRYAMLPAPLRDTVKKYFVQKTELKNVAGQELYYMKAKNKLNSIYGMSVQSPVKQSIDYIEQMTGMYDPDRIDNVFRERSDDEIELLQAANKKAFQNYAWGVWTTAWARWELQQAIDIAGDQFIYCDTDSVKFYGDLDFTSYNKKHMMLSKENGACAADPAGVMHYLGVYELDGEYKRFVTMGAKKYAYEYEDGKIGITVAGVAKSKGAEELQAAGGLDQFKTGFTFRAAGGTESVYNDIAYDAAGEYPVIKRDGHEIKITSNVLIKDSEYTLGVTAEYLRIIERAKLWRQCFDLSLTD